MGNLGGWEWCLGSDRHRWSDNLYRIFGVEPGEITPTHEFVLRHTHPADKDRMKRHLTRSRSSLWPAPIEFRIKPPDRDIRHLRSTITMIESDARGPKRIVGAMQDVTDQLLADRALAAHAAVAQALADWECLAGSGERLLCGLAEALEVAFVAMWLPEGDTLKARLEWSESSLDASEFEAATRSLCVPRGVGFLGRVWERKTPVTLIDVVAEPNYRRGKPAARAGLHGVAAFPVLHAGEVLAVLELYTQDECRPSARITQTMVAIGNELGQFLSRRQGQLLHCPPLTPRELQVLQLAANGFSRSQIASHLTIGSTTVASHMQHIFEGLGVRDRASAVATALRLGLIN